MLKTLQTPQSWIQSWRPLRFGRRQGIDNDPWQVAEGCCQFCERPFGCGKVVEYKLSTGGSSHRTAIIIDIENGVKVDCGLDG